MKLKRLQSSGAHTISMTDRLLMLRRYRQIHKRLTFKRLDFSEKRRDFYRRYWTHACEVTGATLVSWGNEVYELQKRGRSALVQYHLVNTDSYFAKALVDDKRFTSELVAKLGFSTPRFVGFSLRHMPIARDFLRRAEGACVVKPQVGSGGTGITTGIDSEKRLAAASLAASNHYELPPLMIEEQIAGDSFRLLFLDGQLLDAVRRGSCTLVGDGRTDLKRLVPIENQSRLDASGLESISQVTPDLEARFTLEDQGLDWRHVPNAGERVVVKRVSNQNSARDQQVVTELVHPDYTELALEVKNRIGPRLIGIDVMSKDISQTPREGSGMVNEINIPPGLHYHEMTPDRTQALSHVGPRLLEFLLEN